MDLSGCFDDLMHQSDPVLTPADTGLLRDHYQILFIRGFLGDLPPQKFNSYFACQMKWLAGRGITCTRLEHESGFGTQKLPKNNVEPIETSINDLYQRRPKKRLLIISHSKGGLDTLETLLGKEVLREQQVAGWIALQAPFHGTPLADRNTNNRLINWMTDGVLRLLFNGDKAVIRTMCVRSRQTYMAEQADAIYRLSGQINIINFASHISASDPTLFLLRRNRRYIEQATAQLNDGIVPEDSQIMTVDEKPCCPFVRAAQVDHIYPVIPIDRLYPALKTGQTMINREKLFLVLLKLWIEKLV